MKKYLLAILPALLFSAPAQAAQFIPGEFSTTVSFVSDYVFRGITQTDEGAAVQGSIDWSHDSGFYAGVWGSNVEFGDASLETDLYAGYAGEYAGFSYDVGLLYYVYPGADRGLDYNYGEGALSVGYDFGLAALTASYNYSPEFFAHSGDANYLAASLDIPLPFLPLDATLNGSVGRQWIEDNDAFGVKDYTDWGVGVSFAVEGFDLGVRYTDTNLSEPTECADGCDGRVVVSISKTLP